jgi:hypothetical protein
MLVEEPKKKNEEIEVIDETDIEDHGPLPEVVVKDTKYRRQLVEDGDDN